MWCLGVFNPKLGSKISLFTADNQCTQYKHMQHHQTSKHWTNYLLKWYIPPLYWLNFAYLSKTLWGRSWQNQTKAQLSSNRIPRLRWWRHLHWSSWNKWKTKTKHIGWPRASFLPHSTQMLIHLITVMRTDNAVFTSSATRFLRPVSEVLASGRPPELCPNIHSLLQGRPQRLLVSRIRVLYRDVHSDCGRFTCCRHPCTHGLGLGRVRFSELRPWAIGEQRTTYRKIFDPQSLNMLETFAFRKCSRCLCSFHCDVAMLDHLCLILLESVLRWEHLNGMQGAHTIHQSTASRCFKWFNVVFWSKLPHDFLRCHYNLDISK